MSKFEIKTFTSYEDAVKFKKKEGCCLIVTPEKINGFNAIIACDHKQFDYLSGIYYG